MKQQCDHHLAVASSSLPFNASESDPEDFFWRDFFDFSFLTSEDDQKSGLGDDIDSNALPKESELYIVDSNVTQPLASVLGVTTTATTTPVDKNEKGKEAWFSPLFTKMSALRIKEGSNDSVPKDDTEVDSPCWKGAGSSSVNLRRSRDDLNVLYGLNPMAPQFIPSSNAKNGKEFEGNGSSSSLKRSLSSTFPPSSGEFSVNGLYEAGIEHGLDQKNSIGVMDQSLGLVCQDSVSEAMGLLDISHEFQRPKKLDPLAPVFVPAYTVVHDKSGVADHMISTERNAHSTYASSEVVGHIGSNVLHQSGKIYSSNPPRLGSQVQKKKLNPLAPQFSLADTKPKVYGSVENQAPNVNSSALFSPVNYKELHAGFAHPSVHVEPSYKEVDTKQMMGRHRSYISHANSSPQMDVKKLLTTIHGLSELLTHVHGSGSPNEQDLQLINSTVQNLNSYINNQVQERTGITSLPNIFKQSVREHQIPKARNLSSTVDIRRKEKFPMVLGDTGAEAPFENGFGQVVSNHETEEQINPQVLFYKSLWLKARADSSLMEYETFLSSSRT